MIVPVAVALALAVAAKPAPSFVPKNRPYDVQHYRIDVRLHNDGAFQNEVSIRLKPKKALTEVELDSFGLAIKSATVDGATAKFALKEDAAQRTGTLTVKPSKGLSPGKEALVVIAYSGKALPSSHEGFFTATDDAPGALPAFFTQFEPTSARRFFPCNDEPADKASTEIFAIVDGRYEVLSNGKKVLDEAFTEGDEHLRRVHWVQDAVHSTYLVALAVGQFEDVEVGGDFPATLHVQPGQSGLAFISADATRGALESEAHFLGVKFPWDKYDQVAVPHFYWGGMENTSISFERSSRLVLDAKSDLYGRKERVGLIAHELAHQWFGDLVTLKWWDDAWLNEGFATYLGPKAEAAYFENDAVAIQLAERSFVDYFHEEDGPRAHALVGQGPTSPADIFDHTSYVKGAAILRMLEGWVGVDEFRKALAAYLNQYAHANASSDDFFNAVAKATKKDKELKPFREAWLRKKGYPVVIPQLDFAAGTATVTLRQRPNRDDEKGPFVFKLPIVLHRESEPKYSQEATLLVDKAEVTAKVDVPAAPEWVNWNKDGAALVRVEIRAVSEEQWIDGARKDPDPVWRLQALYALLGELVNPAAKELVRPSDAGLDALLGALGSDPSPYVREAVMHRLGMARWKRLPKELGPVVLALAKSPRDLAEDPVGLVRVKHMALETLGKIEDADGHAYLLDALAKKDLDINYLGGLAVGTGRIGTPEALAAVRATVAAQVPRGYPYFRTAVAGLGALATPDAVPLIADVFRKNPGIDETARAILDPLQYNATVTESSEFAAFVRELVITDKNFGDDLKAKTLALLDDVKTPEAKEALTAIAAKSDSDRLRSRAQQMLDHNFPGAAKAGSPPKKPKP